MAPEPPLRDDELIYLRGMMEEHRQERNRKEAIGDIWKDSKSVAVVCGAVMIFGLQVITLIYQIRGGH